MLLLSLLLLATFPSDHPHERDLELRMEVVGEVPPYAWWPCRVQVLCRNNSEDTTYSLVRPGSGSFEHDREPNITFGTESQVEDGTWKPVYRALWGNCGIYDAHWIDEIVQLPPGEEMTLSVMSLFKVWQGNGEQKIRVSFRYQYLARPSRRDQMSAVPDNEVEAFGAMLGIKPFTLVAKPIVVKLEPPPNAPSKKDIEQDLVLTLERQGTGPVFSWSRVPMTARIQNKSKTLTHRIVKHNTGHPTPSLALQVQVIEKEPTWRGPLRRNTRPRVRLDHDWRDEVIALAPGEDITVDVTDLSTTMRRKDVRRAQITAQYRYYARPVQYPGHPRPIYPDDLGSMADVPPFTLQSEPLELTIETPLAIELRLRAEIPASGRWHLTDVVSVYLINRSDAQLELCSDSASAKLVLQAGGVPFDTRMSGPLILAPGEELDLFRDHLKCDGPLYPFPTIGNDDSLQFGTIFAASGWLHTLQTPYSERLHVKIAR